MQINVEKVSVLLTKNEMKMLRLDLTKDEIKKRLGEESHPGHWNFPKKWDERTLSLVKAGCMMDLPKGGVARYAGLDAKTLRQYMRDYGELSEKLSLLMEGWYENMEVMAKMGAWNLIQNGNAQVTLHVLKSKDQRYNPDKMNYHAGDINQVILSTTDEVQQFILNRVSQGLSPLQEENNNNELPILSESDAEQT